MMEQRSRDDCCGSKTAPWYVAADLSGQVASARLYRSPAVTRSTSEVR